MEIKCELCEGTNWKLVIHEERVFGQSAVMTAFKCENCGMVYPLHNIGKNISKDAAISRLKE